MNLENVPVQDKLARLPNLILGEGERFLALFSVLFSKAARV